VQIVGFKIFILSEIYRLQLPVGSLILLTLPTQPTVHTRCDVAQGIDK